MSPSLVLLFLGLLVGSQAQDSIRALWGESDEVVGHYGEELTRADPAYRLPRTTIPLLYDLNITPYFDVVDTTRAFTFDGEVTITMEALSAVNTIVLQCNDITIYSINVVSNGVVLPLASNNLPGCDPVYDFLPIVLSQTLNIGQQANVTITYRGNIQTGMRGFYRSWYNDSTGRRWMGTTQFQPTHARKAFPCYDEPSFKAYFDITINRENTFSPTISNMPIMTNATLASGRIAETFYRTPYMSTYLIAFIVSHYETLNTTPENAARPFAIIARDNAAGKGDWAFDVGQDLLVAMEQLTNISYYTMAENMDMKQVAIPDFSAGAMENWGLLTYREALILYDPNNSNHFYLQRVANIVSHEIVHMWLGNLVTCAWWENTWLNEGFARMYQYFLTNMVRSELGYETRFIVEQLHDAMVADSIDSAHALTNPATNSPTAISAMFSTISYAKGASIIRMTWHMLGYDTYVKALRTYLSNRQFDVSEPEHLFEALEEAAGEDNAMAPYDVNVTQYFKSWSEQAGFPVLSVNVNYDTGDMTIVQSRFERNNGYSTRPSLYYVPITFTRQNDIDFVNTKPQIVLTAQVTIVNKGAPGVEWVLFNKQQTGYYRVNYDETTWDLILQALVSTNRTLINEYNRAQFYGVVLPGPNYSVKTIVDDVFAFARAGVMSYQRAFSILSFLEFEDAYAPWIPAITGFNWLRRRLAHEAAALAQLDAMIIRLSTAVVNRLGFAETAADTYMDGLLRMYLMNFLINAGHPQCVATSQQNFQNLRNLNQEITVNVRHASYCTGLRNGNAEDYNFLFNRYQQHDVASEKIILMTALGCTPIEASLNSFLTEIVADTDSFRTQDIASALSAAIIGNEDNNQIVFRWLQQNLEPTRIAFDGLATPISYITARLINEQQITEFQTWLNANQEVLGTSAYNTGVSGIASARSFLQWTANRLGEMQEFFNNN